MWTSSRAEVARSYQLLEGFVSEADAPKGSPIIAAIKSVHIIGRLVEEAGLTEAESTKQTVHTLVLCTFIFLAAIAFRRPPIVLGIAIVVALQWLIFKRMAAKRRENFERDYTAMLLSLASSIRTGLDPLVALIRLKELFSEKSEVRIELEKLNEDIEAGMQEEQALQRFGATIDHPDLPLFRTAFVLSRKEGSSLSECLQRLARVTRQRQSFRRKVRSAVAMQKLSAFGIGLCAVVIAGIQFLSNPAALQLAWNHAVGAKLLCLGLVMITAGIGWVLKIASPKT